MNCITKYEYLTVIDLQITNYLDTVLKLQITFQLYMRHILANVLLVHSAQTNKLLTKHK